MVQYATATELAGHLQKDLDTYSANQALTVASGLFSKRARTWWAATTSTYTMSATTRTEIKLPYRPVIAVTAVRVNGVVQAVDYTLRRNSIYRSGGFGTTTAWPPDVVDIDYTFGYTTVPDDVKGAVFETAAAIYEHPDLALAGETIGGYSYRTSEGTGGVKLTQSALDLADWYRGILVA